VLGHNNKFGDILIVKVFLVSGLLWFHQPLQPVAPDMRHAPAMPIEKLVLRPRNILISFGGNIQEDVVLPHKVEEEQSVGLFLVKESEWEVVPLVDQEAQDGPILSFQGYFVFGED
jgi:hypothetical protein